MINRIPRAYSGSIGGNDSDTVLLLHCDGADESTTFTDVSIGGSTHTITVAGNTQVDTAQKVFGTGSMLLDGSGDYAYTAASSSDFGFGTGDFTIDWRFRTDQYNLNNNPMFMASNGTVPWKILYNNGDGKVKFRVNSAWVEWTWTPSNNTWYHLAFVRSSGRLYFYVDGSEIGSDQACADNYDTSTCYISAEPGSPATTSYHLKGWLDEIRISKGIARWTANFTPPTGAYTT